VTFTALYCGLVDARISASDIDLPVLFLIMVFLIKQFSLAFLLLGVYAVEEIAARLSWCGTFCCWTFLMWEILLLDFFNVGHSDAGLFSSWTNEQASPIEGYFFNENLRPKLQLDVIGY
jgi:hypothetical protein